MAYKALSGHDHEDVLSGRSSPSPSTTPLQTFPPLHNEMGNLGTATNTLFMEHDDDREDERNKQDSTHKSVKNRLHSVITNTAPDYTALKAGEDDEEDVFDADTELPTSPTLPQARKSSVIDSANIKEWRRQRKLSNQFPKNRMVPPLIVPKPMRSASIRSVQLSPTADLHGMHASIITNVEHLEQTAERLSRASSIDNAIRQLHQEQKRADSQPPSRSSSSRYRHPPLDRQISNPQSILDVNSTARSGGYSPGGYAMISPRPSFASIRGRSSSKGSRFDARPEPELEGRPLDAFVSPSITSTSPILSRSASTAEQDAIAASSQQPIQTFHIPPPPNDIHDEVLPSLPPSPQSTTTFDHAQRMFEDFDGQHYAPSIQSKHGSMVSHTRISSDGTRTATGQPLSELLPSEVPPASNPTNNNRRSLARPMSYADPSTGLNMVYYPAPVPTMLNLPPKLSTRPNSTIMEKRRTQIRSSMLSNVFEDNQGELSDDDENMPLSQRRKSLLRTSTAEHGSLPPQLRASVYFDHYEKKDEPIAIKNQSAVATLDSILDASAYAPVNAFTDHTYGVALGAEVYGKRSSKIPAELAKTDKRKTLTKRLSSNTLLTRRRSSTNLMLSDGEGQDEQQKRRSTISSVFGMKKFSYKPDLGDDEIEGHAAHVKEAEPYMEEPETVSDEDDSEREGQFDDEEYYGPPTTLLAELHLRKHQAKKRTRPSDLKRPDGTSTTLMERETVAQIANKNRAKKRVNLAWEDPDLAADQFDSDEDDMPLGVLYQSKKPRDDPNRPLGLLERKDMEDNEPLSQRRNRLLGRPVVVPRAAPGPAASVRPVETEVEPSNTIDMSLNIPEDSVRVSTQFASDLISQLGDEDARREAKGKGKEKEIDVVVDEEEETLGQRRKRLQAEKEARAKEVSTQAPREERPVLKKSQSSMANILQAHPDRSGGMRANSYGNSKQLGGLLGMHEQVEQARRTNTMQDTYGTQPSRPQPQMLPSNYGQPGTDLGSYNMQRTMMPNQYQQPGFGMTFAQPTINGGMPMATGWSSANGAFGYNNPMAASMMQLQIQMDQFNHIMAERQQMVAQRQTENVERWRRSVMQ